MSPLLKVLFVFPVLFVIEIILGGPIGFSSAIPERYILFILTVLSLLCIILLHKGLKLYRWQVIPVVTVSFFMLLNILWGVPIVGLKGGDVHSAWRESAPYILLLLLPLSAFVMYSIGDRFVSKMNHIVIYTSFILAVFQIILWVGVMVVPGMGAPLFFFMQNIIGSQSVFVGFMPDGFYRVFWVSNIWCFVSFFLVPLTIKSPWAKRILYVVFLMEMFTSYTRAVWLALILSLCIIYVIRNFTSIQRLLRLFGRMLFFLFLLGIIATFYSNNRISSTFNKDDSSVSERINQFTPLMNEWEKNPVLGGGYGTYAEEYTREDSAKYSYELVYIALLMKLGVIGLFLWTITVVFMIWLSLRRRSILQREAVYVPALLMGIFLLGMTNPILINFVGMSALSVVLINWLCLFRVNGFKYREAA